MDIIENNYSNDLKDLVSKIQISRYRMLKAVSTETVKLYWEIGKLIFEKTESKTWGSSVVENLSNDLQKQFPGVKGFSSRNLWNMRAFYSCYYQDTKLQPLVAEIGWVQNTIILQKCENELEREFYIKQTKQRGWSKLDLIEKIDQNLYENHLLAQNNIEYFESEDKKGRVAWEFLDDYNIELINTDRIVEEDEIESTIVKNILEFLRDMGGEFSFVERQKRVTFEGKEYFIDLLFFNIVLNCYVVFELKAREFDPRDLGQLQMYLLCVNEKIKKPEHSSTIGILVCRSKNRTVVEYLLKGQKQPMGVATYNNYSKMADLPENISKYLPSEEEISRKLLNLFNDDENTNK